MEGEAFYVLYINVSGRSPLYVAQELGMHYENIKKNYQKPGERWMVLPSDHAELVLLNPVPITGEEADEFIRVIEELKEKILSDL